MASVSPLSRDPGEFHPREAREQFRQNKLTHITCSQFCAGYLQSNIACVPSNMADDFESLCISNSSPFPLLYRSRPGQVSVPPLVSESDVSESEAENERNFQFDFLIDGIYLQETLDKHMRLYNISTVSLFLLFALIQRQLCCLESSKEEQLSEHLQTFG